MKLNFHITFACKHRKIPLHWYGLSGTLSVPKAHRAHCLAAVIWQLRNFQFAYPCPTLMKTRASEFLYTKLQKRKSDHHIGYNMKRRYL